MTDNKRRDVAVRPSNIERQTNQILTAYQGDLGRDSVLVVVGARVDVRRDEFLGEFGAHGNELAHELDKLHSLVLVVKEEVQPVWLLPNAHALLLCSVLENELLQPEERALMVDSLADLGGHSPCQLGLCALAIGAEEVLNDVLDHEGLLEDGRVEHLLLNGQFCLQPLGMRFGPDEGGVDQLDLV